MAQRHESHQRYCMLILSLLIHLGILVALLMLTKHEPIVLDAKQHKHERTPESPQQPPLPSTVAALRSRASTFGAPVVFHQDADVQPDVGPAAGTQLPDMHEQASETTPDEEKKPDKAEDRGDHEAQAVEEAPIPTKQATRTRIAPQKKPQRKRAHTGGKKRPGTNTRTAAPVKKQLTLADLAEGFLSTLNRGGQDWLDRDGDKNAQPDFKDLKYMSYIQKVVWYMQNEWQATQSKLQIDLRHDSILSLVITFAKNGTVQNVQVVKESGCPQLDEFLIRGIRRAGPYPPLPHHFNSDTFDLPLNIHNAAQLTQQPWGGMNLSSGRIRSR